MSSIPHDNNNICWDTWDDAQENISQQQSLVESARPVSTPSSAHHSAQPTNS